MGYVGGCRCTFDSRSAAVLTSIMVSLDAKTANAREILPFSHSPILRFSDVQPVILGYSGEGFPNQNNYGEKQAKEFRRMF